MGAHNVDQVLVGNAAIGLLQFVAEGLTSRGTWCGVIATWESVRTLHGHPTAKAFMD